ncbi:MAG: PD-(D/E)XK nuclease family protein, partial [Clostridia bacterium]|nr:PD-(D/E)XK nuclease family protein [Clostridia bacterium]
KPESKYRTEFVKGILKDKDLGLTYEEIDLEDNTQNETLSHIAFNIKNVEQVIKEEMRLLYVALTRAKNKLSVVGKAKITDDLSPCENAFDIENCNNYLKLILGVLSKEQIKKLLSKQATVKFKESQFNYYVYDDCDIPVYEYKDDKKQNLSFDKNNFEKISNFEYSDLEAVNTRLKNTVTALQEENDEFVFDFSKFYKKEEIVEDEDNDSPLEKGNAYHNIMRHSHLDINNLENLKLMSDFKMVKEEEIVNCINIMSKLGKDRKIYEEKMFLMNVAKDKVKESTTNQKVLIQGVVDIILEGDNDIIVVDYKTTKGSDKFLRDKYSVQLSLYALAVEDFFKKPVSKKYVYSFCKNKLIEV